MVSWVSQYKKNGMWVHLIMFHYRSFEMTSYSVADVLPDLEEDDSGMCVHGCEPQGKWKTETALQRFLAV